MQLPALSRASLDLPRGPVVAPFHCMHASGIKLPFLGTPQLSWLSRPSRLLLPAGNAADGTAGGTATGGTAAGAAGTARNSLQAPPV